MENLRLVFLYQGTTSVAPGLLRNSFDLQPMMDDFEPSN